MNSPPLVRASDGGLRVGSLGWVLVVFAIVSLSLGRALFAYAPPDTPETRLYQPVRADEGFILGRFVFSPSITLSTAWDDNIFAIQNESCARKDDQGNCIEPLDPVAGTLSSARGNFALKLPFSHSYASLVWNPQYRKYGNFIAPRSTSNTVTMTTRLNFASGSTLTFYDDYADGYDDYRRGNTQGEIQFGSANYTRHHPGIQYDWSFANQWGVIGRLERIDQKYGASEAIDFSAVVGGQGQERTGIVDLFDFTSDSLEVRGYRNFSNLRFYASAQVGRTNQDKSAYIDSVQAQCRESRDPDHDGTNDYRCPRGFESDRIDQSGVNIGVTGLIFPRTQGDVTVGYVSWTFKESGAPDFGGLVASGRIDHTFSDRTRWYFEAERKPLQSPANISGYYLQTDISMGFERSITGHLTARAGFHVQHYHFSGSSSIAATSSNDYTGEAELRYRPGSAQRRGPWSIGVLYNPVRRQYATRTPDFSTNRVTISAQFGWF